MHQRLLAARPRSWPAPAASVLLVLCGCEAIPAPPPPKRDEAKQTLERALASWREGETVEGMAKASPPIKVSDQKWEGGKKLTKFELQGPAHPAEVSRPSKSCSG